MSASILLLLGPNPNCVGPQETGTCSDWWRSCILRRDSDLEFVTLAFENKVGPMIEVINIFDYKFSSTLLILGNGDILPLCLSLVANVFILI
jgi:hypothetical protein